jgi:hypothetical protein
VTRLGDFGDLDTDGDGQVLQTSSQSVIAKHQGLLSFKYVRRIQNWVELSFAADSALYVYRIALIASALALIRCAAHCGRAAHHQGNQQRHVEAAPSAGAPCPPGAAPSTAAAPLILVLSPQPLQIMSLDLAPPPLQFQCSRRSSLPLRADAQVLPAHRTSRTAILTGALRLLHYTGRAAI